MPAVSVLLPAFNAERYVDCSIRSVVDQSFGDWEIVAVDDFSGDSTHSRLQGWQDRDPRVRVFANPGNRGMTGNWNVCLSRASGKYVLKLDADDVLRPRTLELLHSALETGDHVAAAVRTLLCGDDLEPFGAPPGDGALIKAGIDPYRDHDLPAARWMEVAMMGQQPWQSSALMVPREWLVGSGAFDERFGCVADTELILRILRRKGTVAHRAYVGSYYRQTEGSVSQLYRRRGWLEWEGVALLLFNFQSLGGRPLPRAARLYRVRLWCRWNDRHRSPTFSSDLPSDVRANLERVVRGLPAPPLRDRVDAALRRLVARW